MKERSFDEMIAYFNRRVSEMDIAQDYKMELLGMVTALGYKHEKTAQRWIPCSERLPQPNEEAADGFIKAYLVQDGRWMDVARWNGDCWIAWGYGTALINVTAWMPLPEPWRGEEYEI